MHRLVLVLSQLWLAILTLATLNVCSAAPIDLRNSPASVQLPAALEYRFSEQHLDSPTQLDDAPWQLWPSKTLHLIGESRQLWLRIPLTLDTSTRRWLLQSEWPQMGRIHAFIQQDGQLQALRQRQHERYPTFELPATRGDAPATLYVAVAYSDISLVPLRLLTDEELQHWREQSNLWLGLFFGLGMAVILFNFFLWLSTRTPAFFWYVLFQIAVYTFEAVRFGVYVPYLGEASHGRAFVFSAGLAFVCGNLFAIKLLEIEQIAPRHWQMFRWVVAALSLYVLLLATPWSAPVIGIAMPIATFGALVPVVMALLYTRAAQRYLKLYSLAWGLLILGTLVLNLNLVGLIGISWISTYGQLVGLSIEALLLSFVLGARMNDLQRERTLMANELLTMKQEANQRLQREVEEKTRALNLAMAELRLANASLTTRSLTDPLTGIANRRQFDEVLPKALARADREKSSLCLALFDIDHFKSFNDRYGHLVGDDCLRQVAQTLQEHLQRPDDLLARYGGEEFVLLLPATQFEGALQLLEELRGAIAAIDFYVDGQRVPITVSGGCTSWPGSPSSITPEQLIEAADQQLYLAKQQGRNRICGVTLDSIGA